MVGINLEYLLIYFVTGCFAGMIANHMADCFPLVSTGQIPYSFSRPVCVHCKNRMGWKHYLLIKPCPYCHSKRSVRSWLLPILFPILFVAGYLIPSRFNPAIIALMVFYATLVAVIDLENHLIIRILTLIGFVVFFVVGVIYNGLFSTLGGMGMATLMAGALYVIERFLFPLLTGKRGGSIGLGDIYLTASLGVVGYPGIHLAFFILVVLLIIIFGIDAFLRFVTLRYEPYIKTFPFAPILMFSMVVTFMTLRTY